MCIMIICHWAILHYNMSFKTIAGRSDGVFSWFAAFSEDQEKICMNSPKLSCGFKHGQLSEKSETQTWIIASCSKKKESKIELHGKTWNTPVESKLTILNSFNWRKFKPSEEISQDWKLNSSKTVQKLKFRRSYFSYYHTSKYSIWYHYKACLFVFKLIPY